MYTYEILQREDFFLFGLHEDAYHFFFTCTNYTNARNNYFHKFLLQLGHFCVINTHLLLWGDESLSTIINNQLVFSVFALPFFCNSICTFCSKYSCKFLYVFVLCCFNGEDHVSFLNLYLNLLYSLKYNKKCSNQTNGCAFMWTGHHSIVK